MTYPVPRRDLTEFIQSVEVALRRPFLEWDGQKPVASFAPDLDATEQQTYADLLRVHRSRVGLAASEYAALRDEFDDLRTYHALASPTAAQTAAATKAIIRVLRAILD